MGDTSEICEKRAHHHFHSDVWQVRQWWHEKKFGDRSYNGGGWANGDYLTIDFGDYPMQ